MFDSNNPVPTSRSENDPILLYVERDPNDYCLENGCGPDPAQQAALELADGTLIMPLKTEALQDDQDKNRIVHSFPRVINGKPVLAANDQSLNFVFGQRLAGQGLIRPAQDPKKFHVDDQRVISIRLLQRIWFQTAGLMYNGKLDY